MVFERLRSKRSSKRKRTSQIPSRNHATADGEPSAVSKAVPENGGKEDQSAKLEPPDHSQHRADIEESMNVFLGLVSHSMRPLPDRTIDKSSITDEPSASLPLGSKGIGTEDTQTLKDKIAEGSDPVADDSVLVERVMQLVSDLPTNSIHRQQLTKTMVNQLLNPVQHPPLSYLGDKSKYRQADGSHNNVMQPTLGKANTPYARLVVPETIQPGALPDPGVIFDALFVRHEFEEHPNKISSILFYWTSIITHDLFQTDHSDFTNSRTSSYLDLSPLYGNIQEEQDQIRTFENGKLKPDCFSEHRLLTYPPGCGVLLIMLNRFHNHVAEQLAAINEDNRFPVPRAGLPPEDEKEVWAKRDHDLFNVARLVTCGLYINITLVDYVRTILNLNRSNSNWTLDPQAGGPDTISGDRRSPIVTGRQASVELNMIYRWYSSISDRDDKWEQGFFETLFSKAASDMSMADVLMDLYKWEQEIPKDPFNRQLHDHEGKELKRDENGKFNDDDLTEIVSNAIEDCAGAFGANHIPQVFKAKEILGMQQARAWECGSLNELRRFFGLSKHDSFESINPDPRVATTLRALYEHPDRIELYPGIVSEKVRLPTTEDEAGSVGFGPFSGDTVSRAILSELVAAVRCDRFYTIDYHAKNLTNWGFIEAQNDTNGGRGCCFSKLFLKAFPNHFLSNSIYAHQPMTIPSENRKIMERLGRGSHYSWERPMRQQRKITIQSYKGVKQVLQNPKTFEVIWGTPCEYLFGDVGNGFMLSDKEGLYYQGNISMHESLDREKWYEHIKDFYENITLKLLKQHAYKIANVNQIDIARDVGNLANVHFVANFFSMPLRSEEKPQGVYLDHELYLVLAVIFLFIFSDIDSSNAFQIAIGTRPVVQQLGALILENVKYVNNTRHLPGVTENLHHMGKPLEDYGIEMIRRLLASGKSEKEIAWSQIICKAAAIVANQAQLFTQILEFYLCIDKDDHWAEIVQLASSDNVDVEDKLRKYVLEGIRLNGTLATYRTNNDATVIYDEGHAGKGKIQADKGANIFVSFVRCSRDPGVFPEPEKVKLNRPLDSYIHSGTGQHDLLGRDASHVALTAMLKTVARLKNLRCAPGPQGRLKKIPREEGFCTYMTEDWGKFFPLPTTWKLHFDGDISPIDS